MSVRKMRPQESIEGLIDITKYVSQSIQVKKAIEIGSYMGESTVTFAENFSLLDVLYAVDPFDLNFNADHLFDDGNLKDVMDIFYQNIKPYEKIKHIKDNSKEASKQFDDESFDFIYIDGCHEFSCVIEDIQSWKPKVKKGCFISFHDANDQEVSSAISNYFDLSDGYVTKDYSITFMVK